MSISQLGNANIYVKRLMLSWKKSLPIWHILIMKDSNNLFYKLVL